MRVRIPPTLPGPTNTRQPVHPPKSPARRTNEPRTNRRRSNYRTQPHQPTDAGQPTRRRPTQPAPPKQPAPTNPTDTNEQTGAGPSKTPPPRTERSSHRGGMGGSAPQHHRSLTKGKPPNGRRPWGGQSGAARSTSL